MSEYKFFTTIEQSDWLLKLGLNPETADMRFDGVMSELSIPKVGYNNIGIPSWSLDALLEILNHIEGLYPGIDSQVSKEMYSSIQKEGLVWQVVMYSYETGSINDSAGTGKHLIDAVYETVCWCLMKGYLG